MRRVALSIVVLSAFAFAAGDALAKAKAKPKGVSVTQSDIQTCIGANGSSPKDQVTVCTKIINSGKVKPPYHGDYYALRGAAYYAMQDFENALADTDKAITIRPKPETYFQRALIHMALQKFEPAKADLAQVMKQKPTFAPSYFMRGVISYDAGAYTEAVTYFDGAVQRLATYYQAIYARGLAKKKAGDEAGGEKDIRTARGMSSHVEKDMEKFGFKL